MDEIIKILVVYKALFGMMLDNYMGSFADNLVKDEILSELVQKYNIPEKDFDEAVEHAKNILLNKKFF